MQNEILLVISTQRDKQSTSSRVLYLFKISKSKEIDLMSKSIVDRMIFNYLMIRLIKKINLRKIKNENETFNIHCDH